MMKLRKFGFIGFRRGDIDYASKWKKILI